MARIVTEAALREIYAEPKGRSVAKELAVLDRHCQRFISLSPFCVVSTRRPDGGIDLSPRGAPAAAVAVEDEATLLLPDRPGNNRLDTMLNLLADPQIGLLFMIPGVDETLRVRGLAELDDDAALCARFAEAEKPARLVTRIRVTRAYLHCAKAFMRSRLWDPAALPARRPVATMGEMLRDQTGGAATVESQHEMVRRYESELY
jgi:PPOX class probable FMN-dependent enzyme